MSTLSDQGLSVLQRSHSFYINSNFSQQGPSFGAGSGYKLATIDDFVRALPFERYDRDPLNGVTASRPSVTEPWAAFMPGADAPGAIVPYRPFWGVAEWFPPSSTIPLMDLDLETEVDATYETFYMRRIGAVVQIDPYQQQIVESRAGGTRGPDPIPTLIRAASLSVVRSLSRTALNNIDAGDSDDGDYRMLGLAKYYDDLYGGVGGDPQVFKAANPLTLAQVRKVLRKVSPSVDGFGMGANALVMSRRCRDLLIATERAAGLSPTFQADPEASGELRYFFDGVPVYVGPVREDEDASGSLPAFATSASPWTYDSTSIYAMRLGGPTGVRVLHFGGESASYGVQVEAIQAGGTSAALGYRVHGYYTLFIPERQACARLWGIDISGEAD